MRALINPFKGCQHASQCGWSHQGGGVKFEIFRIFQIHSQMFPAILGTLVIIPEALRASALMGIMPPEDARGPEAVGTQNLGLKAPTNASALKEV